LTISCSYQVKDGASISSPLTPLYFVQSGEDEDLKILLAELLDGSQIPDFYNVLRVKGHNSSADISGDDEIIYRPHKHFFGKDLVEVYWSHKSSGSVILTVVEVEVSPVNDAPVAFDDVVKSLSSETIVDVLANDIEVDGGTLEVLSVDSVPNLNARVTNNKVELTPLPDFNESDEHELTYRVRDDTGLEVEAKIFINKAQEDEQKVPIRLIFIGSSSSSQVGQCSSQSGLVIDRLNANFKKEEKSYIGVSLESCEDDIVDDALFLHCDPRDSSCNDFDKILSRYGNSGIMTLVFVDEIEGPVAGIAKMNKLPSSGEAAVVSERNSIARGGVVYTHEIGHLLGLDHTQQVGGSDNDWIPFGSCGQSLRYFQRGYESNPGVAKYSDSQGILWDDHQNIMKSEVSPLENSLNFFSDGYQDVFSVIFNCYRARSI